MMDNFRNVTMFSKVVCIFRQLQVFCLEQLVFRLKNTTYLFNWAGLKMSDSFYSLIYISNCFTFKVLLSLMNQTVFNLDLMTLNFEVEELATSIFYQSSANFGLNPLLHMIFQMLFYSNFTYYCNVFKSRLQQQASNDVSVKLYVRASIPLSLINKPRAKYMGSQDYNKYIPRWPI